MKKLSKRTEATTSSFNNVEPSGRFSVLLPKQINPDLDEAAQESEMDNEVAKYTANSEFQSTSSWKDSSPKAFGPVSYIFVTYILNWLIIPYF